MELYMVRAERLPLEKLTLGYWYFIGIINVGGFPA
jgi:hypothetical protein